MRKKRILAKLEKLENRINWLECGQRGHKWRFEKIARDYYPYFLSSPENIEAIDGYIDGYKYKCKNCGTNLIKHESELSKAQLKAIQTLDHID